MKSNNKTYSYASVALNLPIDQLFQYEIPESLQDNLEIGNLVYVPFGNRKLIGCVIKLTNTKEIPKLKEIIKVVTPDFKISHEIIKISKWISEYYFCSLGESLSCTSFIGFNDVKSKSERYIELNNYSKLKEVNFELNKIYPDKKFTKKQMQVIDFFIKSNNTPLKYSSINNHEELSLTIVCKLLKDGCLKETFTTISRDDEYEQYSAASSHINLNDDQRICFYKIKDAVDEKRYETFLLYGITSSGKTEIYLQAIDECLKVGKQAVVLVPEISLTPQTVDRFRSRFKDIVGVYHSRLNLGQKFDLYRKIKSGEVKIIVGARSALFSPFNNLGLIVIDEEHETTFKQSETPRYNTRDAAVMLCKNLNSVLILGSATPSLESYYNSQIGKFTLLNLPERVEKQPLPEVEIIDMRMQAIESKSSDLISSYLTDQIQKTIDNKEQVMILQNRRGFSNFILCFQCNTAVKCKYCDVTMTYHKDIKRLMCHYCGYSIMKPEICPTCQSKGILELGAGTQKVEEELINKFPDARILRLDLDTTSYKKAFSDYWKDISSGNFDILLGTQMIAKGFHLENVTLVGVISADQQLFLPDFRVAERTFSLLTQVAGRAGRGDKLGRVIIQTYMPNHYTVLFAQNHDFMSFYKKEMQMREIIKFPPFYKLATITFSNPDLKLTKNAADIFAGVLRKFTYYDMYDRPNVLGPVSAPISKAKNKYRLRILIRARKTHSIINLLKKATEEFEKSTLKNKKAVNISIDIDPKDML